MSNKNPDLEEIINRARELKRIVKEGDEENKEACLREVISAYEGVIEIVPENEEALFNISQAYNILGDHEPVINLLSPILERDDTEPKTSFYGLYFELGDAYIRLKRFDEAIKHYQSALKINPKSHISNNNLGLIYLKLRKLDKAVEFLTTSIGSSNPHNETPQSYALRGDAHRLMGNPKFAETDYKSALRIFRSKKFRDRFSYICLSAIRAERGLVILSEIKPEDATIERDALDNGYITPKLLEAI
jgi:tetratricopeptide (TPR) repeat protein